MKTGRLEAFSDGVLAIIITIMVLEMKIPQGASLDTLKPLVPLFLSYVLSFFYLGIYWNNHHHLFQAANGVNGKILWANLNLLFWLSLFPFVTGWMGENNFNKNPVALYGIILLLASLAYKLLIYCILKNENKNSIVHKALKKDPKGNFSLFLYIAGIGISLYFPKVSLGIYFIVALIWLIPEKRIERIF
ncbi:TMEM175 family protein [uncultured Maribacter sp.]|uniref:TMEM175 family protein n=1 Tax=uncultured Maribacter sp. TaxID=431308 RepID=UPI002608BE9F|nr:TMEM175 family protein [uncultured Maribacter sp.]